MKSLILSCWIAIVLIADDRHACNGYITDSINGSRNGSFYRPYTCTTRNNNKRFRPGWHSLKVVFGSGVSQSFLSRDWSRNTLCCEIPLTRLSLQSTDFDDVDDSGGGGDGSSEGTRAPNPEESSPSEEMWRDINEVATRKVSLDMLSDPEHDDPLARLVAENAQNEFLSAMKDVKEEFNTVKEELGSDGAVEFMIDRWRREEEEEKEKFHDGEEQLGVVKDAGEEEACNEDSGDISTEEDTFQ